MSRRTEANLMTRLAVTLGVCMALLWMAGCTPHESDEQIRQQAQQATERARVEAQKAAAEAKVAAANAAREAHDVASGVKAGMRNGHHGHAVDINSASRTDLETLPGITPSTARLIVAHRPYDTPHDLVRKRVVSEAEYDRIAGDVVAQ